MEQNFSNTCSRSRSVASRPDASTSRRCSKAWRDSTSSRPPRGGVFALGQLDLAARKLGRFRLCARELALEGIEAPLLLACGVLALLERGELGLQVAEIRSRTPISCARASIRARVGHVLLACRELLLAS
jgi:hypothetical protein